MSENADGQLTGLQRAFVNEWFKDFNGTRAAERAGYSGDDNALAVRASETLRNSKVGAEIERRWAAHGVSGEEVIARLAEQARANISDFYTEWGAVDSDAVQEKGHLIKRITQLKGKKAQIELYDAQAALVHIGRTMGLFIDKGKVDITTGGESLKKVGVSEHEHRLALFLLADAFRSELLDGDSGESGAVGATEQASDSGASEPGG